MTPYWSTFGNMTHPPNCKHNFWTAPYFKSHFKIKKIKKNYLTWLNTMYSPEYSKEKSQDMTSSRDEIVNYCTIQETSQPS